MTGMIKDDRLHCPNCGCATFEQRVIVTFHEAVPERVSLRHELASMKKEIYYVCTRCEHKLDM